MIDRSKRPPIAKIEQVNMPDAQHLVLPNGIPVYFKHEPSTEILKFEYIHRAGRTSESHRQISRATASLLKEGTLKHSSAQLAEAIDFYGSSVKSSSNMDFAYSSLYTMRRHFGDVIPYIREMYDEPLFAEDELQKFIQVNIQKLKEELSKNEVNAYRMLTEEMFGSDHPYGYNSTEDDYLAITRDHILQHYKDHFGTDNAYLFLCGNVTDVVIKEVEKHFGSDNKKAKAIEYQSVQAPIEHKLLEMRTPNEHQSALKIGRRLFNKTHPDNASMFLLNSILGGYFGSRLMMSIREEKGYTYDIYSSITQMLHDGFFYIGTEAAPEYIDPIIDDIYKEIHILQQDLVTDKELSMVKNYNMGTFLNMLDGPLNTMQLIKTLAFTDQTVDDFRVFLRQIVEADAPTIRAKAQEYLNREQMIHTIVSPI
jgi:zinc protease